MSRKFEKSESEILSRNIGAINYLLLKKINQIHHTNYEPKMAFSILFDTQKLYIHDSTKAMKPEHFKDYEFAFNAILRNLEVNKIAPTESFCLKRSEMKLGDSNFLLIQESDRKMLASYEDCEVYDISKKVLQDFVRAKKVMLSDGNFSLELRDTQIGLSSKKFGFKGVREYSVPMLENPYDADDEGDVFREVVKWKMLVWSVHKRRELSSKLIH